MSLTLKQMAVGHYEGNNPGTGIDFSISPQPDQNPENPVEYIIDIFDSTIDDCHDAFIVSLPCENLAEALDTASHYIKQEYRQEFIAP